MNISPQAALPFRYELRVKGNLPAQWSEWFEGFELIPLDDDETLLAGACADQSALHGVLIKIRDLNLVLLEVRCVKPGLDPGV